MSKAVAKRLDVTSGDLLDLYIAAHEEFWKTADEPAPNTIRPYWRASSLGKCLRSQCLERAGVPRGRAFDDKARRTFQLGDDIHWFVRRRWARMGLLLGEEIEITDAELALSGHIDAVMGGPVQDIPEDWRIHRNPDWIMYLEHLRHRVRTLLGEELPIRGVEIKSINAWAFRHLDGVRSDHALQAAAYALLGERHPDSMPGTPEWWEILYLPKDPLQFHPRTVVRSWKDEAYARLEELNEAWGSGSWPNCTCGLTEDMAWESKYCSFPNEADGGCCGQTLLDRLEQSLATSTVPNGRPELTVVQDADETDGQMRIGGTHEPPRP